MKRFSFLVPVAVVAVICLAVPGSPLFAYGEQIESSLRTFLNWIFRVPGVFFLGWGVFTGVVAINSGDTGALKGIMIKLLSGVVLIMFPKILELLTQAFGQ